jgi:hypothetical protein
MESVNAKFSLISVLAGTLLVSACAASKNVLPGEVLMIVCHDDRRTLTLPESAAMKHHDHGDNIGACAGK